MIFCVFFLMRFLCNLLFKPTMLCFSAICKHKEALAHIDSKEHLAGLEPLVLCSTQVTSRRAVGVHVQTTRSLAGAALLAQTWKWIIMAGWIKCLPCLIPHLALRQGVFWFLANNKCNPSCLTPWKLRISLQARFSQSEVSSCYAAVQVMI